MAIESAGMSRRIARIARVALVAGLIPAGMAVAQLPITAPAPVSVGSVIPFNHGATGEWGQIYSMSIAPNGNILFLDSQQSAIYQLAPGSSEPTLVVGAAPQNGSSNCSDLEPVSSYFNAAIAFDSANNLYVTDRYGSSVQFCRVPYDAASGTWLFTSADIWAGPAVTNNGASTPISPQALVVGDDGTFYVSWSNSGEIDKFTVNESTGVVTSVTRMITGLEEYASNLAVDHAGNLFFLENIYGSSLATRVSGIREIPASASLPITGTGDGSVETQQTLRIDPASAGFTGITGITFDLQGNLYFTSIDNTDYSGSVSGVFMIPNQGTPKQPSLDWSNTVMVSPVYAGHPVMIDPRGYLWIPTGGSGNWVPTGTLAPTCDTTSTATADATCLASSIVLWKPGAANLGLTPVGGSGTSPISAYSVPSAGGTLSLTAKNAFTEGELVTISASSGDPLYALNGLSFYVLGTGLSSTSFQVSTSLVTGGGATAATVAPAGIATLYYSFNQATTPQSFAYNQVGTGSFHTVASNPTPDPTVIPAVPPCTAGSSYPAFSAIETQIPQYSWCSMFVKATPAAAGGVASELQMLAANGSVISGSNAYLTGIGQGSAVSALASAVTQSIASGLNSPQQVAADALGNTYVADSALKTIEVYPAAATAPVQGKLLVGATFSAPTGVAIDGAGNLYIGDSGNVFEIPSVNGSPVAADQTTIASGLGNQLNLATDSAGDVFVADKSNKRVVEVPNAQTALLLQGQPALTLGSSAGFSGPSAIATDASGNVWVADGNNLWEITMPFGVTTEVLKGLQGPITGLAVDPSGSVFITDASGLVWVPYQSSSGGLNVNGMVQVAPGLGKNNAVLPTGVALDSMQNIYAIFGNGASAGLAQVGISGTINFNNYGEINPNVPFEADVQLFNLGNTPLTPAAFADDLPTGTSASDFSVGLATENAPACSPSSYTLPGGSCYLGLIVQALAAGQANASVPVLTNAANAGNGLNIAMAANVVQDLRAASSVAISISPATGVIYPGAVTVTVTVSSPSGTPGGTVDLTGSSASGTLAEQTQTLNGSGVATFTYSNLLGGTYTLNATYTGEGTAGATQNTCSPANSACFAGSAQKATFVVAPAKSTFTVAAPTGSSASLTVYNGSTFLALDSNDSIVVSVTSAVGAPTGTVTFCSSYTNGTCTPADPTQGVNGAMPLNAQGQVTFNTVNLTAGVYNLVALYSGDVNYALETVSVPSFQVIVPSVEITSSPTTLSITPGTPVQATLTLMPLVGFSGDVYVECLAASLPLYTECTFDNPEIDVGGGGAVASSIVVTISTNVPVNGGTASIARQAPWSLAGLFGLGLLGLMAGRKRLNRYMALLCLACMFSGLFAGISACTNAGYSTAPPAPKVTTPQGSFNVQIITYSPSNSQQNSLATPVFVLPTTVQ